MRCREKGICWVLVVAPGRAACRNTQQRAALNTDGSSQRVLWSSPSLRQAPTALEPRQMHQRKQGWAALARHSSCGLTRITGTGRSPSERDGKCGASHDPGSHLCVCAWMLPGIRTDPGSCPHCLTHPSTTSVLPWGEQWERHQERRCQAPFPG